MLTIYKNREELKKTLARRYETGSAKAEEAVREIIKAVRERGDEALFDFSECFDGFRPKSLFLSEEEKERLLKRVSPELYKTIEKAAQNIRLFHEKQLKTGYVLTYNGKIAGQRVAPLKRVGLYVPGGTAAYPSTVLMNAIPARVAGVEEIIIATPAKADGVSPAVVAAAKICGVDKILGIGGAQAIAALAYGTQSVPRADKIVGPGNIYVSAAKRLVYGVVDIDMIAGPSEVLVIADEMANPRYVAADLLSQAEHDAYAASILITNSDSLIENVNIALDEMLSKLPRRETASKSVASFGCAIRVADMREAVEISDEIAPEHLELSVSDPFALLELVHNAGSVFLGAYTPEPLGDYFAGPNHVLPTNGTARFASPLGVDSFIKRQSFLYSTREALLADTDDIIRFAEYEGLSAHAAAVKIRRDE